MAHSQIIWLIEDDEKSAEQMKELLSSNSFSVKWMKGMEGQEAVFAKETPQLILMEIFYDSIDGYALLKEIRQEMRAPIIIVSKCSEVIDKVLCLELGADDYLAKPYDDNELIARVKAVLRRCRKEEWDSAPEQTEDDFPVKKVVYSGLSINLTDYAVHYQGKAVAVPPKELELFYFLASRPNQVFTREQLISHVWGYGYIGGIRTVDVHIKRLRRRFTNHPEWELVTVRGVGYKFACYE